jgi:hypothetical protein
VTDESPETNPVCFVMSEAQHAGGAAARLSPRNPITPANATCGLSVCRIGSALPCVLASVARRFVVSVMSRLVRLSYWDHVRSVIPEAFLPLVPPKPEPLPLPADPVDAPAGDAEAKRASEFVQMVRTCSSGGTRDGRGMRSRSHALERSL